MTVIRQVGMRTLSVAAALMLLASCQGEMNKPAQATTIQGCISSAQGAYRLTDGFGHQYDLVGDTSQLRQNVGHEMVIRGSVLQLKQTPEGPAGPTNRIANRVSVTTATLAKDSCTENR